MPFLLQYVLMISRKSWKSWRSWSNPWMDEAMKKIDLLLKAVRFRMLKNMAASLMMDDGNFITALGLDPEAYAITLPNGEHGYDSLKALNDCASGDWSGDPPEDKGQDIPEGLPSRESRPDPYKIPDVMTVEDAATALYCLTRDETEQILQLIPVVTKGQARHITIEELEKLIEMGKVKPVAKTKDLFGWG